MGVPAGDRRKYGRDKPHAGIVGERVDGEDVAFGQTIYELVCCCAGLIDFLPSHGSRRVDDDRRDAAAGARQGESGRQRWTAAPGGVARAVEGAPLGEGLGRALKG